MHITLTQDEIRQLLSMCVREGWLTKDCEYQPDVSTEDIQLAITTDNTVCAIIKIPESIV